MFLFYFFTVAFLTASSLFTRSIEKEYIYFEHDISIRNSCLKYTSFVLNIKSVEYLTSQLHIIALGRKRLNVELISQPYNISLSSKYFCHFVSWPLKSRRQDH